jgi:LAO/AO transport system kinase
MSVARAALSVEQHVQGVLAGDRAVLGRTISLVESHLPAHREKADAVLHGLLPHTGRAHRVGVSGVPGVGKSTFLEGLGVQLLEQGRRVAVLAIDPSSSVSGGSILGDKTRMERLAADRRAFIRPSPSSGALGGVHRKTRETLWVCEAAGFDVVFVETVGVGQSEIAVADMVDSFLVLLLAGAGDELQGIKKGILELADVLAINKADGPNQRAAERAQAEMQSALRLVRPAQGGWAVPVVTCSGLTGMGLDALWEVLAEHRRVQQGSGAWEERRLRQRLRWMWAIVEQEAVRRVREHAGVREAAAALERAVAAQTMTPGAAADRLLAVWEG